MENFCTACNCTHDAAKWYNSKTVTGLICRKAYMKEHYDANKAEVNAQRRNQYNKDPEYREKVNELNKARSKERIAEGYKRKRKPRSEWTEEEKQKAKEAKQRYKQNHPDRVIEQNKQTHAKHYRNNLDQYKIINKENSKKIEYQYSNLKSNALRRGIEFKLTFEEYKAKRIQPCHYCNQELEETGACLDRLDNNIRIYHNNLTVPCCHICNYLKSDLLTEEETLFAILALKKYYYDNIMPDKIVYKLSESLKILTTRQKFIYLNASIKFRGLESTLTYEDFEALFKQPFCFYCGGDSTGLDRLDNTQKYCLENCVPCCPTCNNIKSDIFSYEETYVMVNAIQRLRIFHEQNNPKICCVCNSTESNKWIKHPNIEGYLCSEHYKEVFKSKNAFYNSKIDYATIREKHKENLRIRQKSQRTKQKGSVYSLEVYERYKDIIASRQMKLLTDFDEYLTQTKHKMLSIKCSQDHIFNRTCDRLYKIETCPICSGHSNKDGAFIEKLAKIGWDYISGEYKNKTSLITAKNNDNEIVTKSYRWFGMNPSIKPKNVCHQKIIKDSLLIQDLEHLGKDILDQPLSNYIIQMVPFESKHKEFIETYEWLGTVGNSPKWTCEATCNGHLAGVILFNEPSNYSKNILDSNTKKMECLIQRGASASWAHKHLGSKMVMFGCNWLVKNTEKRIFVGYSDPSANEIGTIYQACNFDYLGNTFGATTIYIHPNFKNGKTFTPQSLRRTAVLKKYLKSVGINWDKNWEKPNGFKDLIKLPKEYKEMWYQWGNNILKESKKYTIPTKGKYVLILGSNRREQRALDRIKIYAKQTYPKHKF
jgi:hypothetical protein